MTKIKTIPDVNEIAGSPQGVFVRKMLLAGGSLLLDGVILPCGEVEAFHPFNNGLVFQEQNGSPMRYYDFNNIQDILPQGFYFQFNQNIDSYLKVAQEVSGEYKYLLLDSSFHQHPMIDFPSYCVNGVYIRKKRKGLSAFIDTTLWQVDISGYGILRTYNGDQVPNEIDGDLMSYCNLLYVPLRGGQLLALDARTGEKVWMADYGDRSGFYTQYERYIYKHDGLSLIEIDAITGETLRKMIFSQGETGLTDFYALHMFWVYEDVIVLSGLDSKIVLLDRKSFKVLERIDMDTDIPASKDSIIWHNNRLYVLDLANTLHVFEREAKSNI